MNRYSNYHHSKKKQQAKSRKSIHDLSSFLILLLPLPRSQICALYLSLLLTTPLQIFPNSFSRALTDGLGALWTFSKLHYEINLPQYQTTCHLELELELELELDHYCCAYFVHSVFPVFCPSSLQPLYDLDILTDRHLQLPSSAGLSASISERWQKNF